MSETQMQEHMKPVTQYHYYAVPVEGYFIWFCGLWLGKMLTCCKSEYDVIDSEGTLLQEATFYRRMMMYEREINAFCDLQSAD